jgi:hypothetical protein
MKTKYLVLSFFLLIICDSFGQHVIKGLLRSTGGEVISYANIISPGKKGGVYSNEEGYFEIKVNAADSITFSCVGYNRLTIVASEILTKSTVYLHPDITQLDPITVVPKEGRAKMTKQTFGYTKTKRRSLISSGLPGVQFATFIENNLNKDGFIETVLLGINCDHKCRIRVRLYNATSKKEVGTEITKQNLLFDVSGNHKPFKIDLSSYQFTFPKEGIVVGIEFLGELGNDNKIIKGTTSSARLYLTDGNDYSRNTWENYRDQKFYKESFSANQNNTSNALIGLSAVFYQDQD